MSDKRHTSNDENSMTQEERAKVGITSGIVGIVVNIILFIVKIIAGLLAGSVSILADGMNNLGDSAGSGLTIGGFYISNRPPDREHPFGHQRAEYISGLFIAIIILIIGFQFLVSSFGKIINPAPVEESPLVIALLILSIILKAGLGIYYYYLNSRKFHSSALNALMKDSVNDSVMTIAVILSYIIEIQFNWYIDGYIGLLIALMIIYSGMTSVMESSNYLLGVRPDSELIESMQDILDSYDSLVGYHDLIVHKYGPNKIFATVDIEIDSRWTLKEAHSVIDHIEGKFEEQLLVVLVGHLDPVELKDDQQNTIHSVIKQTLKSYDQDFHFHDLSVEDHHGEKVIRMHVVIPEKIQISNEELYNQIVSDFEKEIKGYKFYIKFDRNYLLK